MSERVFVDTNIWVYAVDAAEPSKRQKARAAIAPRAETDVVISSQVLSEFYTVVTRKLEAPLSEQKAAHMVDRLAELPVVTIDADLVLSAIAASQTWGISLWDALIVRAAEVAGCTVVLSEDLADGRPYGTVRIVDPLA